MGLDSKCQCYSNAGGRRVNWEKKDGTHVIPFFASLGALRLAIEEQQPFLALPARVLFEMTQGTTLVLNPASDHAKEFQPDEIRALLATGMNQAPQARIVREPTQVLLGQPAEYPERMVAALAAVLAKHPSVRAAYLCLMQDPSQAEPSLVVGFEGDGGLDEAMRQAGSVAADTAPRGIAVDFVEVLPGDAGISAYFRQSVRPFYERSLRAEPEQGP
jgi:hypothetical protein